MKLGVLLTAAVFLALAPNLAGETVRFQVPFAFVGYDSEFPAGEYIYTHEVGSMTARLISEESLAGAFIVTRNNRRLSKQNGPTLIVFERFGRLHVLRELHSSHQGMVLSLPLSHRRNTLVQSYVTQNIPGERIVIAASR